MDSVAVAALISNFVIALASPWLAHRFTERSRLAQQAHDDEQRQRDARQALYASILQADDAFGVHFDPGSLTGELREAQLAYYSVFRQAQILAPPAVHECIKQLLAARGRWTALSANVRDDPERQLAAERLELARDKLLKAIAADLSGVTPEPPKLLEGSQSRD
jgi:hypothetical protein